MSTSVIANPRSLHSAVQRHLTTAAVDDSQYPSGWTQAEWNALAALCSGPCWAALVHIFSFPELPCAGTWEHIHLDRGGWIDCDAILANCGYMSGGEYRLVQIAVSSFSLNHPISLRRTLFGLDPQFRARALEAISILY